MKRAIAVIFRLGLHLGVLLVPIVAAAQGPFISHVATGAALAGTPTVQYPTGVWRDTYSIASGAPPLPYKPETGTCASNGRTNDGGSCINTTAGDGNSWYAVFPSTGADARQFGDVPDDTTDNTVAMQAAMNYAALGHKVTLPSGTTYTASGVTVTPSGPMTIAGGGQDVSIWRGGTGVTILAIQVAANSSFVNSNPVTIEDVTFRQSTTANSGVGIAFNNVTPVPLTAINWSSANGGTLVATTSVAHGLPSGASFTIVGVSPSGYNGSYTQASGLPLTNIVWSSSGGGTVTATTAGPHSIAVNQSFTISGVVPSGYNGTYTAASGTTGSTLVYALASNPGTYSVLGQTSVTSNTLVASLASNPGSATILGKLTNGAPQFYTGAATTLQNLTFRGNGYTGATTCLAAGITEDAVSQINFINDNFWGCNTAYGTGVRLGTSSYNNVFGAVFQFQNCLFQTEVTGIQVLNGAQGIVVNNTNFSGGTEGIWIPSGESGLDGLIVSNSNFGQLEWGIYTQVAEANVGLTNNLFTLDLSNSISATTSGVVLQDVIGCTIVGNNFQGFPGSGKANPIGVSLVKPVSGPGCVVGHNTFGNLYEAVVVGPLSTVQNRIVDNIWQNNTANVTDSDINDVVTGGLPIVAQAIGAVANLGGSVELTVTTTALLVNGEVVTVPGLPGLTGLAASPLQATVGVVDGTHLILNSIPYAGGPYSGSGQYISTLP